MNEHKKITEEISLQTEANSLLRSAYQIALREGKDTNWEAFKISLWKELIREQEKIIPKIYEIHIDGVFANKDELGFHLWWKGDKGFGSIRISEHIQNDMFFEIDSENMSKEFVEKALLSLLVGAVGFPEPPKE